MIKELFLFIKITLFVLILSVFSCNRNTNEYSTDKEFAVSQIPLYHTWLSLKEMEYKSSGTSPLALPVNTAPHDFFPWAGIVSHHILAHDYIDAWFFHLSQMRDIKRFFIISPDHYGVSLQPFSLTVGNWDSGISDGASGGFVKSDSDKVIEIAGLLEVSLDPNVFFMEHGISALMPYIKKYFPDAEVIAIAVNAESEVNTRTGGKLADVLEKEFDKKGKNENFLLISSDFSHKGGIEETSLNDYKSIHYLKNINDALWNTVICDNRMGIYILDRLGKRNSESVILYHTNSYNISGYDEDITSYFFVYFADKE
ncbi:MAG: AmmeMemoRadiSam system protein B [Treponema sp.]|jgi:AmmeMemoRadiSam system protein B|nr:AmmeMemoRadiSam system protein B [Treponema sp.]